MSVSERTKVYIPDDNFVWLTGEVVKEVNGSTFEVEINDTEYLSNVKSTKVRIVSLKALNRPLESLPLQNETTEHGVEDMTTLNYLHEASILDNLRRRFFCQRPYTYTGDICIAVHFVFRIIKCNESHKNCHLGQSISMAGYLFFRTQVLL
jgi:myosin-5